jgi:hypothetical protein
MLSHSLAHNSGAIHSAPVLLAPILLVAINSAYGHRSVVQLCADRSGHRHTGASHGYHQDQSPDRTCHGFLLTCGSPGSGNP